MICYILAFEEPLIKVGISKGPASRWYQLTRSNAFDLGRSYLVRAENGSVIRSLECSIKTLFARYRRESPLPLSSGNTEIFDGEILPSLLKIVEAFAAASPHAGISVERDLSAFDRNSDGCRPSETLVPVSWRVPRSIVRACKVFAVQREVERNGPFRLQDLYALALREYMDRNK